MHWIDITAQWDRAHSHLRPAKTHLPLLAGDNGVCPCCSEFTVRVLAGTRIGESWTGAMPVEYCSVCDRFFVEASVGAVVTAVDARLWFDQPTFLNIEPTTRCNFNCWYCIGRQMKQEDIVVTDFAKVLENFPSVKTIALVGEGEPLMHKDFFTMAHMAKDRGIRVMIISNGSAFSQSVIKQLCEAHIAYIGISIDSANAATFATSRLDGNLPKIWEGIKRLREFRDTHGYQYPRIGVKGTLFTHTQNELPSIIEEAKRNGVEIFESFQALNPMKAYIPIYPKDKLSELASVAPVASAIHRDSANARDSLQPFAEFCAAEGIEADKTGNPNVLRKNCDEQWVYSLLSGDVTPCCQIKTPIDPSWNLFNHTMSDILQTPSYENVRFNLWNGLFPNYCEGCWKTR